MTEDDVRRIVREEIQRASEPKTYRGIPLPPIAPFVPTYPAPYPPMYPQPYMPMHPTYYPWSTVS